MIDKPTGSQVKIPSLICPGTGRYLVCTKRKKRGA